jgi:hypothetical protein
MAARGSPKPLVGVRIPGSMPSLMLCSSVARGGWFDSNWDNQGDTAQMARRGRL